MICILIFVFSFRLYPKVHHKKIVHVKVLFLKVLDNFLDEFFYHKVSITTLIPSKSFKIF